MNERDRLIQLFKDMQIEYELEEYPNGSVDIVLHNTDSDSFEFMFDADGKLAHTNQWVD